MAEDIEAGGVKPQRTYYGDFIPAGTKEYASAAKAKDANQQPDYVPDVLTCPYCGYTNRTQRGLDGHISAKHKDSEK